MRIPPSEYSGRLTDGALFAVFYGAMHGEDIWMSRGIRNEDWVPEFLRQFCTVQLPYFYLNRHARLTLEQDPDGTYTAGFSDGVVSRGRDGSIFKNGVLLKEGTDVILPLTEDNRTFIAYSEGGRSGCRNVPDAAFRKASVWEITAEGNRFLTEVRVKDGTVELDVKPNQALVLLGEEDAD